MRAATGWRDFALLDASSGEKLERWGDVTLIRPDPQVIWNTPRGPAWGRADAHYHRSDKGGRQLGDTGQAEGILDHRLRGDAAVQDQPHRL